MNQDQNYDDDAPGLPGRLTAMAALAGVLLWAWQAVGETRRRRAGERPRAPLPERLQTWENEGGRADAATSVMTETVR